MDGILIRGRFLLLVIYLITLRYFCDGFTFYHFEASTYSNSKEELIHDTRPVDSNLYRWGKYGSWSSCTQSCGQGFQVRRRSCYHERDGVIADSFCDGSPQQIRICREADCLEPENDYRNSRCSEVTDGPSEWLPLYNTHGTDQNPCWITCQSKSYSRWKVIDTHVPDGTRCLLKQRETTISGICVNDICMGIGCDGYINSTKTKDICGVCGGNHTTCHFVSEAKVYNDLQVGYNTVFEIPQGATNVKVYEVLRAENYLSLSASDGTALLNGNYRIDVSKYFIAVGTLCSYRRTPIQDGTHTHLEMMSCRGPINDTLVVRILTRRHSPTSIVYEYSVPLYRAPSIVTEMTAPTSTHSVPLSTELLNVKSGDLHSAISQSHPQTWNTFQTSTYRTTPPVIHSPSTLDYFSDERPSIKKSSLRQTDEVVTDLYRNVETRVPQLLDYGREVGITKRTSDTDLAQYSLELEFLKKLPFLLSSSSFTTIQPSFKKEKPSFSDLVQDFELDDSISSFMAGLSEETDYFMFWYSQDSESVRKNNPDLNTNSNFQSEVMETSGFENVNKQFLREENLLTPPSIRTTKPKQVFLPDMEEGHTDHSRDITFESPIKHMFPELFQGLSSGFEFAEHSGPSNESRVIMEEQPPPSYNISQPKSEEYSAAYIHGVMDNQIPKYVVDDIWQVPTESTPQPVAATTVARSSSKISTTAGEIKTSSVATSRQAGNDIIDLVRSIPASVTETYNNVIPNVAQVRTVTHAMIAKNTVSDSQSESKTRLPQPAKSRTTPKARNTFTKPTVVGRASPGNQVTSSVSSKRFSPSTELSSNKLTSDKTFSSSEAQSPPSLSLPKTSSTNTATSLKPTSSLITLLAPKTLSLKSISSTKAKSSFRPLSSSRPSTLSKTASLARATSSTIRISSLNKTAPSPVPTVPVKPSSSKSPTSPPLVLKQGDGSVLSASTGRTVMITDGTTTIKTSTTLVPTTSPTTSLQTTSLPTTTLQGTTHKTTTTRTQTESREVESNEAELYFWKVTDYAPCSSTCERGVQREYAYCYGRQEGATVDDSNCNPATKPNVVPRHCASKSCKARWEIGEWSQCSVTCGRGLQFRTISCWQMVEVGHDRYVHDNLCKEPKPSHESQGCEMKPCGSPKWQVGQWSTCSADCGDGVQTRDVYCTGLNESQCDPETRPNGRQHCNIAACLERWIAGPWSNCQSNCGIRVRRVDCYRQSRLIPESNCAGQTKPLSNQLCGSTCSAKWVAQEWGVCEGQCGRSFRRRTTSCQSMRNGVMREEPTTACRGQHEPPKQSGCALGRCGGYQGRWLSSGWGQCSVTCGTGYKTRRVNCYRNGRRTQGCNQSAKPPHMQTCSLPACPQPVPVCNEIKRGHCRMVQQANLCHYPRYKKQCCQTCASGN